MGRLFIVLPALLCLAVLSTAVCGQTIGQAKLQPDGTTVTVTGTVTMKSTGELYIEDIKRASGIWVLADTASISTGIQYKLTGTIRTLAGERFISEPTFTSMSSGSVTPLGMANKAIGGAPLGYQKGISILAGYDLTCGGDFLFKWVHAYGANNTGLLITTWGRVKAIYYSPVNGASWFYIDDGSRMLSDISDRGILVYSDVTVNQGDYVRVTGISSVEYAIDDPQNLIRVVRTRDANDVIFLEKWTPSEYPFSDEFNSLTLDPRWGLYTDKGAISVKSNPGWLKLTMPETGGYGPEVIQHWTTAQNIDVRLDADFSPSSTATQRIAVMGRDTPFLVTSSKSVCLFGLEKNPMGKYIIAGNNRVSTTLNSCYFRITIKGVFYSADGITYNQIFPYSEYYPYYAISIYSSNTNPINKPFAGYCDFFRITPAQ